MEKNLFIVRSPLQAFNATEAQRRFCKSQRNVIIVFYRKEVDRKLVLNVLSVGEWSEVIVQPLKPHYELWKFLHKFIKEHPRINQCFIGDHSTLINYFMNRIRCGDLTILDDGSATIRLAKLHENRTLHKIKKTAYSRKSNANILINRLLRIDPCYYYQAKFFTIYDLPLKNKVIRNDYRCFREQVENLLSKPIAFFIGSNLIEQILINTNVFEQQMQQVADLYKKSGMIFYYILHRKEDTQYMKALGRKLGFECVRFDNIIEIEFLTLGYIPTEVSTFLSSAIQTLPLLYPSRYRFFKLSPEHITARHKESVLDVQKHLAKEGITPYL